MKFFTYAVAVAVAAGITFGSLKPAYGELVFEDDLNNGSAKAKTSETAGDAAPQARIDERKDLTKAEMMRRQRLREELKNEDMLTQKLEELRLKDEMKRTDDLLGTKKEAAPATPAEPLQEQRVGSAAADVSTSVRGGVNPQMYNTAGAVAINGTPSGATNQTVANVEKTDDKADDNSRVTVTPKFGTSSITNSIYDVSAKFAAGLNISMDMTDYIAFSGGYSYASYALGAGSAMYYPSGFNTTSYLQKLNMNDNVIDLGIKGYFLNTRSKVRPFVGAGGAYRKGYVNYDDRTQAFLRQYNSYAAQDVEISGFAGYIETGLDFKITKSISLTGSFRYFNVFSSKQSNPLDPNAFLNPNGYGYGYGYNSGLMPYYGGLGAMNYGYYGYNTDTRGQASDALSKNNFYQLMAGVSITF